MTFYSSKLYIYKWFKMINFLRPETMRIWGFNYGKAGGGKGSPRWVKSLPAVQELQETRVRSLGREDPLEEEMATHPSIVAWEISCTEKPGGLQSTGSQRVRHDWSDLACLRSFILLTRTANSALTISHCSCVYFPTFHVLIGHAVIFFSEVFVKVIYPFYFEFLLFWYSVIVIYTFGIQGLC